MRTQDWTQIWHNPQLDLELLRAFYVEHVFPRHAHDYYVICLITQGRQSFRHQTSRYTTPPGGLIFINPDVPHTGEPVDERGFEMLCFYPTVAHMQNVLLELGGRAGELPFFKEVRVDHAWDAGLVAATHRALTGAASPLESESRYLWMLAQLIQRYAGAHLAGRPAGRERKPVEQARCYIEENYAQGITLAGLAAHVALSPYYLLRAFRAEVGMPPYVYLESVRIRQAQRLLKAGQSLAETALAVGFSSQSHFTARVKQSVGVTPGQFARGWEH